MEVSLEQITDQWSIFDYLLVHCNAVWIVFQPPSLFSSTTVLMHMLMYTMQKYVTSESMAWNTHVLLDETCIPVVPHKAVVKYWREPIGHPQRCPYKVKFQRLVLIQQAHSCIIAQTQHVIQKRLPLPVLGPSENVSPESDGQINFQRDSKFKLPSKHAWPCDRYLLQNYHSLCTMNPNTIMLLVHPMFYSIHVSKRLGLYFHSISNGNTPVSQKIIPSQSHLPILIISTWCRLSLQYLQDHPT